MSADDKIQLKLEIDGQEQADKTTEKIARLEKALEKAKASMAAAEHEVYDLADAYEVLDSESTSVFTSAQQVGQAMRAEAEAMGTVGTAATKASTAADKMTDANKKATKGGADLGYAVLQVSRGLEDLQYGFAGVVNNIPGVVTSLGLSAGVAGAVSLLAVGINVALPTIKALWDALKPEAAKEAASQIETLTKRIDELKDMKVKLAVDRHELDVAEEQLKRLRQLQAEYEANARKQSVGEVAAGKETQAQLEEAGLPEIQEKLRQKYLRDQTAQSEQGGALGKARADQATATERIRQGKEEQAEGIRTGNPAQEAKAEREIHEGEKHFADAQERARKVTDNIAKAAKDHAAGLIKDLREGHAEVQTTARGNISRELAGVGEEQLGRTIAGTTPETIDEIKAKRERVTKESNERIAERKREAEEKQRRDLQRAVDSGELAPAPAGAPALPLGPAPGRAPGVAGGIALDVPAPTLATNQAAAAGPSPAPVTPNLFADLTKALIAEAETAKMLPGAMLDHVRDGIVAALTRTLPGVDRAKIEAQAARLADKAIDDKKKADAAADKKEGKDEKTDDTAEAKATHAEAQRIDRTLGKQRQVEFESRMNVNREAFRQGDPSAVRPEVMEARLRNQMEREFRQRGASPAAASQAAGAIAGRGNEDLGQKAAAAAGAGLNIAQQTIAIQSQLIDAYQRMTGEQQEMKRELKDQGRRIQSTQRGAWKRGQ
jgi:hypothetical protein